MADLTGQYLGRYYLTEHLGEGGMAVVYKAFDTRLERDVAVKIIRSGAFPTDTLADVLKRFEREAKSLARLSHPNIVKVHDYGEHEGSPFLVMEYLPGGTLKKMLGKPVPWKDAVRLLLPIARGVAYAHQRGILHRDIKPANILITEGGEPMLSDFGIAKLFEGDQVTALTGSGMVIGTPEYMAPEQWTGQTSPQSDLYSLAITLYEMVAGRKPYLADTPAAILIKQATEPLPSPRKFVANLPEELEQVLVKALAKEPENRYQSLNPFIDALENLKTSASITPHPERSHVEETFRVPAQKLQVSAPVKVPQHVDNETQQSSFTVASQKVETPLPSLDARADKPSSVKFFRNTRGRLIAGILFVFIAWLGSAIFRNGLLIPGLTSFGDNSGLFKVTGTSLPAQMLSSTFTPSPSQTVTSTVNSVVLLPPRRGKDGMALLYVPAGEFTMGSDNGADDERPAHTVTLDAFWIDQTEVTNAMYAKCVAAGICAPPGSVQSNTHDSYFGNREFENYPVIYVDWNMAKTYCEWVGRRLPGETEWEKAASWDPVKQRKNVYPWGDLIDYCSLSNSTRESGLPCTGDTTEVGSYPNGASPYGALDMAGNVWEWVNDWYGAYPGNTVSDSGYGNTNRVLRGSGWSSGGTPILTRRYRNSPAETMNYIGFRCAMSATP